MRHALVAASYVLVGWAALAALPRLPEYLSTAPLLMLAAGAVLYIARAAVYATHRPNPWPAVFGFHEIFPGLVVLAAISHFLAFAG